MRTVTGMSIIALCGSVALGGCSMSTITIEIAHEQDADRHIRNLVVDGIDCDSDHFSIGGETTGDSQMIILQRQGATELNAENATSVLRLSPSTFAFVSPEINLNNSKEERFDVRSAVGPSDPQLVATIAIDSSHCVSVAG